MAITEYDIPEFIATHNLSGLVNASRKIIKVQPETRDGLLLLADEIDGSLADAVRYAIEVGIAALYQAGVIEPVDYPKCEETTGSDGRVRYS